MALMGKTEAKVVARSAKFRAQPQHRGYLRETTTMDDFDPSTRREMETFLAREQANAKLQHTIQTLTTTCMSDFKI